MPKSSGAIARGACAGAAQETVSGCLKALGRGSSRRVGRNSLSAWLYWKGHIRDTLSKLFDQESNTKPTLLGVGAGANLLHRGVTRTRGESYMMPWVPANGRFKSLADMVLICGIDTVQYGLGVISTPLIKHGILTNQRFVQFPSRSRF
jgi:hypothetical protein